MIKEKVSSPLPDRSAVHNDCNGSDNAQVIQETFLSLAHPFLIRFLILGRSVSSTCLYYTTGIFLNVK